MLCTHGTSLRNIQRTAINKTHTHTHTHPRIPAGSGTVSSVQVIRRSWVRALRRSKFSYGYLKHLMCQCFSTHTHIHTHIQACTHTHTHKYTHTHTRTHVTRFLSTLLYKIYTQERLTQNTHTRLLGVIETQGYHTQNTHTK